MMDMVSGGLKEYGRIGQECLEKDGRGDFRLHGQGMAL